MLPTSLVQSQDIDYTERDFVWFFFCSGLDRKYFGRDDDRSPKVPRNKRLYIHTRARGTPKEAVERQITQDASGALYMLYLYIYSSSNAAL